MSHGCLGGFLDSTAAVFELIGGADEAEGDDENWDIIRSDEDGIRVFEERKQRWQLGKRTVAIDDREAATFIFFVLLIYTNQ